MAANDPFGNSIDGTGTLALWMENITPSNSNDLPSIARMIYVGVGGDVSLVDTQGNTILHKNAAAGSYLGPFRVSRVNATGTTATNMVAYV